MNALRRIRAIAQKEARQLARDRLTVAMVVGIPMLQILLFGYAINMDVRNLRAGVADQAGTALSRELVGDLQAGQVLRFVTEAPTPVPCSSNCIARVHSIIPALPAE